MNDITKNMQMDIVSLNVRFHDLEIKYAELRKISENLKEIINTNIEMNKLFSLKGCKICNGNGYITNEDHCKCCENFSGEECSNCKGDGNLWC